MPAPRENDIPVLHLPVRTLVEQVLRSGDLHFGFGGNDRGLEGIRLHQKIQKARGAAYRAEVAVDYRHPTPTLIFSLSGRIDGVDGGGDVPVIEEIKTTRRDPTDRAAENDGLHWGQLNCYGFMYAAANGLDRLRLRLTYVQAHTEAEASTSRDVTRDELDTFFHELIAAYSARADRQTAWVRRRDDAIRTLSFPFPTFRPGQRDMAVYVYGTLGNRGQLLLQAPTGIGKTMAAIFPAVKRIPDLNQPILFYLTARTTGRLAAEAAFDRLRAAGLSIKTLSLTAKEKICFNPGSECRPEACPFAEGFYNRLDAAVTDIFDRDAFTRDAVAETARRHRICPFEFSLELSLLADAVIGDYNYAFDPQVSLRRFFAEPSGDTLFLVDEAHNLVDRSREMFSATLTKQAFLDLRRQVKERLPALYRQLGKINTWMVGARKRCRETADGGIVDTDPPADLLPLLGRFCLLAESWLEKDAPAEFRESLVERFFEATAFLRVAEQYGPDYVRITETDGPDLRVKLFCMDPSHQMRSALSASRASVFFSATLSPLTYFREMFGCADTAAGARLPSPFPPEHLAVLVADRVSTYYRDRERTAPAVAHLLSAFAGCRRGNYLFFFPSYAYLETVRAVFPESGDDTRIAIQVPEMDDAAREAFINQFRDDNPHSLIGFAVMGGVFGEGIDLVGDRLTGAAIVGVGLPGISREQECIRGHFDAHHGCGFEFAYRYPGINRVLQAAGRVIRSSRDRGAILLIDKRYAGPAYRPLLPPHWKVRRVADARGVTAVLDRFWTMD